MWFSLAIVQADFQYLRYLNVKEIRDARCLFAKITAETFGPTSGSGAAAEPLPYFESVTSVTSVISVIFCHAVGGKLCVVG